MDFENADTIGSILGVGARRYSGSVFKKRGGVAIVIASTVANDALDIACRVIYQSFGSNLSDILPD
jgi:hypothetical protein